MKARLRKILQNWTEFIGSAFGQGQTTLVRIVSSKEFQTTSPSILGMSKAPTEIRDMKQTRSTHVTCNVIKGFEDFD